MISTTVITVKKESLSHNEATNLVTDFKIEYQRPTRASDSVFPDEFTVSFSTSDQTFSATFTKIQMSDVSYPVSSNDVFVANDGDEPKKFKLEGKKVKKLQLERKLNNIHS